MNCVSGSGKRRHYWPGDLGGQAPEKECAIRMENASFKRKLSSICYLTAITVAMVGWLSAFGWVAVAVANWASD
jgi:hypothetical protein